MKYKSSLAFFCVCSLLIFMVGSIGGTASDSQDRYQSESQLPLKAGREISSVASAILSPRNRIVPDPVEAFEQLTIHGEWQGFYPNYAPFAKEICICTELWEQPVPLDECMPTCNYDPGNCCPTRA